MVVGKARAGRKKARPTNDEYFLQMARLVAGRSTCLRRQVGAVIVKDKRVLSTGYNGAPRGLRHCDEMGCVRADMQIPSGERHELCRGVHAEQNAIIQAAVFGVSIKGATMYSTHHPCCSCAKIIINAGIEELFYLDDYVDEMSRDLLREASVRVEKLAVK